MKEDISRNVEVVSCAYSGSQWGAELFDYRHSLRYLLCSVEDNAYILSTQSWVEKGQT